MSLDCIYTTAGCSPESDVLDVGPDGILAYGSGFNVILTSIYKGRQSKLLAEGPQDQVHAVRILSANGSSRHIIAAAADGSIRIWDILGLPGPNLKINTSINALAVAQLGQSEWAIAFSSIEGTFYSLSFHTSTGFSEPKKIGFGLKKVVSIGMAVLLGHPVFLAGISDSTLAIIIDDQVSLSVSGHTNWINSIDCSPVNNQTFMVATGSSDRTVRIWKISPSQVLAVDELHELVASKREFKLKTDTYTVACDAIIYGHEGMVNSVRWDCAPSIQTDFSQYRLVTAGADGWLMLWRPAPGGWVTVTRLGDISSASGSGGFFSAILSRTSDKQQIIAHVATGSIVNYEQDLDGDGSFLVCEPIITGHTLDIQSCAWERTQGIFFATTSLDKTTRIWAPNNDSWCEVARPQIHGYEMLGISILDSNHFLSAGDEKILRSFEAPKSFMHRIKLLSSKAQWAEKIDEHMETIVLPALGLSNKTSGSEENRRARPDMPLNKAPTEHDLSKHTLWLETDKLYGHGLEVHCLAVSHDTRLAASASKATNSEDAAIRFWNRSDDNITWKGVDTTLKPHNLTVTKLLFSPSDHYLLTVSRDRHWSVIRAHDGNFLIEQVHDAHSRIIWCAAWGSKEEFFVTGSRDRTLKTWRRLEDKGCWAEDPAFRLQFEHAVTAVAIRALDELSKGQDIMAVGLEDGSLAIYKYGEATWCPVVSIKKAHSKAISDLQWRPDHWQLLSVSNLIQLHQYKF